MKIVEINAGNFGSTGNIMLGIAEVAKTEGHEVLVCCPDARDNRKRIVQNQLFIGDRLSRNLHLKCAELTGLNGCFSRFATKRFLKTVDGYQPDIIHLHNLHNCYINLSMLFKYIKKHDLPVVWTLHDCWAFTGHCPYFTRANCCRWKTGCHDCPQYRQYPRCFWDDSKAMFRRKKRWFTGVENLTVVTPSQWLADLVKQSFLKDYPVKVIHNGIDLSVFRPTPGDFRRRCRIPEEKKLLLGVAFDWGVRKGLDVFVELAKRLDPDAYQIVLVGTNDAIDAQLPKNIISIHRTNNQQELAEIYTAADLFVNPTREENYPTVNMEAIACGTPVITFRTGGSPEILDEHTGSVVACDDIDALEREVIRICKETPYSKESCSNRAKHFDRNKRFEEYIALYHENVKNGINEE